MKNDIKRSARMIAGRATSRRGFTLIEVALAIVVVAVGVMAVFSLISHGLDASAKAIAETQGSIFANGVFNGLRSQSLLASESNKWATFWGDFKMGNTAISVPASNVWIGTPASLQIKKGTGRIASTNLSLRTGQPTSIMNGALRYSLEIRSFDAAGNEKPANLDLANWTRVTALLKVWDGYHGGFTNDRNAMVFYTEFNDPGDM